MDLDNPAARLHRLLEAFKGTEAGRVYETWSRVFGLGEDLDLHGNDPRLWELFRRVGELEQMSVQIRAELDHIDDAYVNRDLVLRWEPVVREALTFSTTTSGMAFDVARSLDDAVMLSLEMCADVLHRWRREPVISEPDLQRLQEELQALGQEVLAAEIPAELRGFLLAHIAEMTSALSDYELRGIVAIRDAFDRMVGAFVRRPDLIPDPEAQGGWAQHFKDVMSQLVVALAVVSSLTQIPGQVRDMLDPGQPSPSVNVVLPASTSPDGSAAP